MKKFCLFVLSIFMLMPVVVSAKAKIDDTVYETFDEAVANVSEGETLYLLDDTDITDTTKYDFYYNWLFPDNVTLDLNGHTIYTGRKFNGKDYTPNSVFLGNGLTIKNGNFESKYFVDGKEHDADYSLFIGDEITTSDITLENLNVENGINIYNALNVTLKDVTTKGRAYYAVWLDEHATATIVSGNYSTKGVSVLGINSTSAFISELTIYGGLFDTKDYKLSLTEVNTNPKYQPPMIYGGTYDYDVTKFIIDEEYVCQKKDEKFIVHEKQYDRDILFDEENVQYRFDEEDAKQVLLDSLSTSKINVSKKDVSIFLHIDETNVSTDVKKNFEEISNGNIASYFDITIDVLDKHTNTSIGTLTELNDKITLYISLPSDMKVEEGYTRVYYVLREHNNVIDKLDAVLSDDGKTLSFASDKFSTYAIAYEDQKEEIPAEDVPNVEPDSGEVEKPDVTDQPVVSEPVIENPKTGDHIITYVLLTSIFALALVACWVYLDRRSLLQKK